MKRVPVTKASYKKIKQSPHPDGVPGINVHVGKPDKGKERAASYLGWGGFGMNFGRPTMLGAASTFYNNSYMNGGRSGGVGDIPPYLVMLNEANGGILYFPSSLKEKYEWYRFFCRSNAFVKRAVELNTDLPLSKLQLRMPKMEDKALSKRIQRFYENMVDDLHLFDKLHSVLFEYNVIGNCLPAGHMVYTPDGSLPIEQVREGDMVLTEKGTFEPVKHIMRRMANEPVYDIGLYSSYRNVMSPTGEHPVFVLGDGMQPQARKAKDLVPGDYVLMASVACDNDVDGVMYGVGKAITISEWFMYLLGIYYANKGCPAVWMDNDPVSDRVREFASQVFGSKVRFDYDTHTVSICDDSTARWMESEFGRTGNDGDSLRIPMWVDRLPVEKLKWLLAGLLDGCGRIIVNADHTACMSIALPNPQVAQSVMRIGWKCGVAFDVPEEGLSVLCTMNANDAFSNSLHYEQCEPENWTACEEMGHICLGGRHYYRVQYVHPWEFNGYVYNLEVENEHTYVVNNVCTHNCFLFCEYDEEKKRWDKLTILPPEEVNVANYPMSDVKRVQYRPEMLSATIQKYALPIDSYESYKNYIKTLPEDDQAVLQDVSYEFVQQIKQHNGVLTFDTDPYHGDGEDKIGSFVYHFAHKRHDYQDLGVSPLECVLIPLLQKMHYMFTQLNLASRNMTPRNLITAEKISEKALADLREQVDQSMLSPDWSIVTNYNVNWEQIGAENRLIDMQRENEAICDEIFVGLGVYKELLTGEGMYSGNKINIEIMNTMFLLIREMLQRFVEEQLFKPVALQNGFYHDDEDGNREWFYPKLGFTRLTIRDNQEVFDQLFQLYQKGSIPIGVILEIFNINAEEAEEDLKKDMFTVNDATYNEMLRGIYTELGNKIVESTDIGKQIAESITGPMGRKLKYSGEDADQGGSDFSLGDRTDTGDAQDEGENASGEEPAESEEEEAFTAPGESKAPANEQEGGNARDYIDKVVSEATQEGESGNGVSETAPENESSQRAKEYIEGLVGNGDDAKVEQYIQRIMQDAGNENDEDGNARSYIEGISGEENDEDEKARKYLESFFNGDESGDDWSDAAQSAGL